MWWKQSLVMLIIGVIMASMAMTASAAAGLGNGRSVGEKMADATTPDGQGVPQTPPGDQALVLAYRQTMDFNGTLVDGWKTHTIPALLNADKDPNNWILYGKDYVHIPPEWLGPNPKDVPSFRDHSMDLQARVRDCWVCIGDVCFVCKETFADA